METQDTNPYYRRRGPGSRILLGLFLFLIGCFLLLKEVLPQFFPVWLFTWPMILIAIGLYLGIRDRFRQIGSFILIFLGILFLARNFGMGLDIHRFLIPIMLVFLGVVMILRPKKNRCENYFKEEFPSESSSQESILSDEPKKTGSNEDYFESTNIFGGTQKSILSKKFRGAEITCIFGGCEIDLSNADISETAIINLSLIFGGGKLIIPADWQVRSNLVPIFGGIGDVRNPSQRVLSSKILILEGACVFGGLEISSYSDRKGFNSEI